MSIFAFRSGKDTGIQSWGDSLTEATAGSNPRNMRWPSLLSSELKVPVFNGGVGGETPTQIAARMLAYTKINTQIITIWAGRNGILYTPQDPILVPIQQMVEKVGDSRFIIFSIINKTDGTEETGSAADNLIVAMNSQLQNLYPNNYLDVKSKLTDPNTRIDTLHLNASGNIIVKDAVVEFILDKGWLNGD